MRNAGFLRRSHKYDMDIEHTPPDRQRLEIDRRLTDLLNVLGIARSNAQLSRACGRNPTYVSAMRKRGYGLHVGSLAFLQVALSRELAVTDDIRRRATLRTAIEAVNDAIQAKCALRQLELHG